jgi:uncharacterized membrane protein (TIGR02234 family)
MATRHGLRDRLAVLILGALGAAVILLTASRPWATVHLHDAVAGAATLRPAGRSVAPVVPAAGLVALAASVAAVTMRTVGRFVAGLLLVLAGGAVAAASVGVARHPLTGATDAIRAATGRTGDVTTTATAAASIWPWIAALAAVPLVLAGATAIVRGRAWSGLSSRYDAPVTAAGSGAPVAAAASSTGDEADAGAAVDARDPVDPVDAWDAVSRGEDPT